MSAFFSAMSRGRRIPWPLNKDLENHMKKGCALLSHRYIVEILFKCVQFVERIHMEAGDPIVRLI